MKQITKQESVKKIKFTPLKNINVSPNKIVRTKILINDISPGVNMIKGYEAECSSCGLNKIVYTKGLHSCAAVFSAEHIENETTPCTGPRGGAFEINIEPRNDTGYSCVAYDPDDHGSIPQYTNVFFSNKIIPQDPKQRLEFEVNIQSNPLLIEGEIVLLPTNKKQTEWMIDVKKFKFEQKQIEIDYDLLTKFKDQEINDSFFANNFLPKTFQKIHSKKVMALNLLSPYKIKLPNNEIKYCVYGDMIAGDPGQSKTATAYELLKYCKDSQNAKIVSVENSTNRGLIGAVTRSKITGNWIIKVGEIMKCHKGLIILDGFGKLSQEDLTQIRSILEEHVVEIVKAGGMKKECAVRVIALSNLITAVENYQTKHNASFNISATTQDKSGKFAGADRRRFNHLIIDADSDTDTLEVYKHQRKIYDSVKESELIKYWNNLREYSWNLHEDQVVWDSEIENYAIEKLGLLLQEYSSFKLDYGILSKKGREIFLIQLPAIALIHNSFDKDFNVVVKKEHADWLHELYQNELNLLNLDTENQQKEFFLKHAKAILANSSQKVRQSLMLLLKYGSQRAVEKSGEMSRMTIYRHFSDPITYKCENFEGSKIEYQYSFILGSGSGTGHHDFESNGSLPPLSNEGGNFTNFGKTILNLTKNMKIVG